MHLIKIKRKIKQCIITESGTTTIFSITNTSKRRLKSIFKKYTDSNDFRFNTSEIIVKLSRFSDDILMSRSEARRILTHLGKFNRIIFDFKGIRYVGQGFVDEIFRVFKNANPSIKLITQNANSDVTFMIKRSVISG
ncbi:MAG: STAS-like domain-containing protein [Oligoflexia bacterium]|nr:STAS-like domain-containing protein [Oligoflexia bacterium]